MTGQCLVEAVDKDKVTLDQFTLLVLDECHHTRGGHPLRAIMNQYMELKFLGRNGNVRLPQVIFYNTALLPLVRIIPQAMFYGARYTSLSHPNHKKANHITTATANYITTATANYITTATANHLSLIHI